MHKAVDRVGCRTHTVAKFKGGGGVPRREVIGWGKTA